ncbi:hypothetical protein DRP98_04980 [candidate division KSB1 bacterium]|nr:MAG: hypothetical protein DRP98_04980 [candidate division KSB1 bacterium]
MPFVRKEDLKDMELPSLIDIIFLLLIFFLVTYSFSEMGEETGPARSIFDLPEALGESPVLEEEVLRTLLFQIEHKDSKDIHSPKVVYALWPSLSDSITLSQALVKAREDSSLHAEFPDGFLQLPDEEFQSTPPCTLIANSIARYKTRYFHNVSVTNTIEIRAAKDTEFRIIDFIMDCCAAYQDTIPRIVFHTLATEGD